MEHIILWKVFCEEMVPYYLTQCAGGKPICIEQMHRIHFRQHLFELFVPGAEKMLYDSWAMRLFIGIDLGNESVPDETTICNFHHFMERNNLGDEKLNRRTFAGHQNCQYTDFN
jgi:IS5 family transposase